MQQPSKKMGRGIQDKFDYDLCDGKVNRIRYRLWSQCEPRIKTCKFFSQVLVSPGSESIMKDRLKKHSE